MVEKADVNPYVKVSKRQLGIIKWVVDRSGGKFRDEEEFIRHAIGEKFESMFDIYTEGEENDDD